MHHESQPKKLKIKKFKTKLSVRKLWKKAENPIPEKELRIRREQEAIVVQVISISSFAAVLPYQSWIMLKL